MTLTNPQQDFQPDAEEPAYIADDVAPPVANLYIANTVKVRQVVSDRLTMATYLLDNVTPVRICGRAEDGVASRVTLTVSQVAANVCIANNREQLTHPVSIAAPALVFEPSGFMIPAAIGAGGAAFPIVIETCEELWAIAVTANATSAAWISALVEQFYGD